ncbi:hypothetical protein ABKN59_008844 [Abortiporus biennis]
MIQPSQSLRVNLARNINQLYRCGVFRGCPPVLHTALTYLKISIKEKWLHIPCLAKRKPDETRIPTPPHATQHLFKGWGLGVQASTHTADSFGCIHPWLTSIEVDSLGTSPIHIPAILKGLRLSRKRIAAHHIVNFFGHTKSRAEDTPHAQKPGALEASRCTIQCKCRRTGRVRSEPIHNHRPVIIGLIEGMSAMCDDKISKESRFHYVHNGRLARPRIPTLNYVVSTRIWLDSLGVLPLGLAQQESLMDPPPFSSQVHSLYSGTGPTCTFISQTAPAIINEDCSLSVLIILRDWILS